MKIILSSMLALAIAGSPVRTQEPDEKEKPKQQEPKKQPEPKAKPAQEPDDKAKPKPKPKPEEAPPPKPQPDERQQKPQKEQEKQQKEQAKKEKGRPPQEQTAPQNNHKQRASGKGQRIPQEKFRASFGREHHFRVARGGGDNRRFQYSGYWFEVVEVWPAGWSFDDDCYIEEDGDDYYLVDVVHPEIRVVVIVVSA